MSESEPTPTPVQLAILRALVAGQTLRQVARAFKLGERTLRRHLNDLSAALGANGRLGLIHEVGRRRWLDTYDSLPGSGNSTYSGRSRPT